MSLLSIKLTRDEFNKIIQLAKAAREYDQFLKGVTLLEIGTHPIFESLKLATLSRFHGIQVSFIS